MVTEEQRRIRRERLEARHRSMGDIPDGQFSVIYADPPWRYDNKQVEGGVMHKKRFRYNDMSLQDICDLGEELNVHFAKNTILFLWATAPLLQEALQVMKAWGFKYRTCAVWDKVKRGGIGLFFRGRHELLLVGRRGNPPKPHTDARPESIIVVKKTRHSEKPEEAYAMIEQMYPYAKYLELFARRRRTGWTVLESPELLAEEA